jgi:hypothetical protein
MRHGEQPQQCQVNDHREHGGRARRAVHGPGDDDSGEECDGPQHDDKKTQPGDDGQEEGCKT